MADATITKTIILSASRETVWSFLTESDKMAQWFHRSDKDLSDGEDYALLERTDDGVDARVCWGTVLQMDAPAKLVYTFTIGPLGGAMTTVTWTLDGTPEPATVLADASFRRNRERIVRDAERELITIEWDLGQVEDES